MRDNRDPEELGKSILATQKHFGCSILDAADRVEALNTNGRYSYEATRGVDAATDTGPETAPQSGAERI